LNEGGEAPLIGDCIAEGGLGANPSDRYAVENGVTWFGARADDPNLNATADKRPRQGAERTAG
jgi:hypothetical protein